MYLSLISCAETFSVVARFMILSSTSVKYEKLFSGSSIGTYKKLDGKWKMSEYQTLK